MNSGDVVIIIFNGAYKYISFGQKINVTIPKSQIIKFPNVKNESNQERANEMNSRYRAQNPSIATGHHEYKKLVLFFILLLTIISTLEKDNKKKE